MKVPRRFSVSVQYILDEIVPPIIRDSRWFMYLPMRFVLKDTAQDFMNFKNEVFGYSAKQFGDLYSRTSHVQELQGETDLNKPCTDEILKTISGKNVLEVGCGRGYLAGLIAESGFNITGCDIVISKKTVKKYPVVKFVEGNIEKLPFKDKSFDTVISTHTLEHVQNLPQAISELRRVAKHELIIVVPRQRPYKYTFSLHTQFFPYEWSLQNAFGFRKGATIKKLGDWFYYEKP
jgi:ubiquinone/menaquinone biosynthesis C-methylase UbiE